jgi:ubiquinone biosynthesis accessory factor UbiJ
LRIDGEVLLAGVLGDLAEHLRWDVEDDLSKVVGDIGANRLARGFAALRDQAADNTRRIESSVAAWLTTEQSVLLDRVSFDDWRAELAQLERRIDALSFAAPK